MIGLTRQRVNVLLQGFRKSGFISDARGFKVNPSILTVLQKGVARQNPRSSSKAILKRVPTRDGLSSRAQMLTRSEGSLSLGEDVTLVLRGVSQ